MPCICLIDDKSRIHEEVLTLNANKKPQQNKQKTKQNSKQKQTQPINQWDDEGNRRLWEGRGDTYLKKCSTSLAIRKIQIKN